MGRNIKYFQRYVNDDDSGNKYHEMICHGICRSEIPNLKLWEYLDAYLDELSEITYGHQVDIFMNVLCRDLEVIKKEVAEYRKEKSKKRGGCYA